MRKYASRFLNVTALGYIFFPVTFLVLSAIFFDIPLKLILSILLEPFFYLLCIISILAGYGLWEMKRWGYGLFLVSNIFTIYEAASLATKFGETHHKLLSFSVAFVLIILLIYRVRRELRVPYFLPKIRWWESTAHYQMAVPSTIELVGTAENYPGQIMDIGMKGCFIKTGTQFDNNAEVKIIFEAFGQHLICDGIVVWNAESAVTHPKGVGIKFRALEKNIKRRLRLTIKKLERVSELYRFPLNHPKRQELNKTLQEWESSQPHE